jgi:SnoaL-like polyketide cyclase
MTPLSRTIGTDQLVDEMVVRFTHTVEMDWMLPGIAPTGKRVEVALVVIVHFRDGKLAHEHIYWDQASVLAQLGLIDAATLPVCGADTARKALDPSLPANALIRRAALMWEGPMTSTAIPVLRHWALGLPTSPSALAPPKRPARGPVSGSSVLVRRFFRLA